MSEKLLLLLLSVAMLLVLSLLWELTHEAIYSETAQAAHHARNHTELRRSTLR